MATKNKAQPRISKKTKVPQNVPGPRSARAWSLVPAEDYNGERFRVFGSALESLSLAAGIAPPALQVMELPYPNSYVVNLGTDSFVAVTPALLDLDLTKQQAEAIMAHGVAKFLSHYAGSFRGIKKKYLVGLPHLSSQPFPIIADTVAARMTGQTRPLKDAIVMIAPLLEGHSVPWQVGMFVELPL